MDAGALALNDGEPRGPAQGRAQGVTCHACHTLKRPAPAGLFPAKRQKRSGTGSRLPDDEIASRFNPILPRGMTRQRAIDSHEAYLERFQRDGKVVPGPPEEDAALAQI